MTTTAASREQAVVEALRNVRVVPVVALDDPSIVEALCTALLAGGIACIEITFRTRAGIAALARATEIGEMLVGAGTVLTLDQARAAAGAGAAFAVAPGTDGELIAECDELGLPFFPGIATPSELGTALRLGRTTVKVFPASTLGGPAFLRAISATFPDVRFVPTGGINIDSLASYLEVPSVIACGGSWICEREVLRERRFDEVERRAREAMRVVAA